MLRRAVLGERRGEERRYRMERHLLGRTERSWLRKLDGDLPLCTLLRIRKMKTMSTIFCSNLQGVWGRDQAAGGQ
jgi:hypothetical protein